MSDSASPNIYIRGPRTEDRGPRTVTRDARILPLPANATLLGIDGLYSAGKGVLIGTQNGTNPQRVIRISLAPSGLAVTRVKPLATNEPGFDNITLGVTAGNSFSFNARRPGEPVR